MDIRLHIVAPAVRREKVFQEIRRPVFSLLDRGPLSESCSFPFVRRVRELVGQPHLSHLADTVMPTRSQTGLFFFRGKPGAPFAVIAPGGGFAYVASVHEGFPYAVAISTQGDNAFALK